MDTPDIGRRRWLILALGVLAQASQATVINGIAFLIPTLNQEGGFTLAQAGTLAGAPILGGVFTLVVWARSPTDSANVSRWPPARDRGRRDG
ncbi:hypothetical protein NJ76_13225, partial [Rhodococcus sp. IITR03]